MHPFSSVAVGSCATGPRESGQGRKAAALSGTPGVPQTAWPPLSRTGADAPGPNVRRMQNPDPAIGPTDEDRQADQNLMGVALAEAALAATAGEVPVGAVVAIDGRIVARRHNEREATGDPTAHAEILALRDAATEIGTWRLDDAVLVVTLEPCPMCAGAAWASRIGRLVWGASNPDAGAAGSLYNLGSDPRLNHEYPATGGIRSAECAELLTSFFARHR